MRFLIVLAFLGVAMMPCVGTASCGDCAAIPDPQSRLACYDAIHPPTESADSLSVSPVTDLQENFGRTAPADAHKTLSEQNVELVRRMPLGELVVTLTNGQVWQQVDNRRLTLKPGDQVDIREGMGGAFYLSKSTGSRALKVRRIQ